jgi:hypothetical protein
MQITRQPWFFQSIAAVQRGVFGMLNSLWTLSASR